MDIESADLFTEISRGRDQWFWFIEAHSQVTKIKNTNSTTQTKPGK